jgi:hypothetical protein
MADSVYFSYIFFNSRLEAGSNTSTVALWDVEGNENGTRYLDNPATWGQKYRELALQAGVVRKTDNLVLQTVILAKSKDVKTGRPDSRHVTGVKQIWQNILREAVAQKGLLCQWWYWWWFFQIMLNRSIVTAASSVLRLRMQGTAYRYWRQVQIHWIIADSRKG